MDSSLVNDIEDNEVIDYELGVNEEEISEGKLHQNLTRDLFLSNSLFIIIYEEDDEYIDKPVISKTMFLYMIGHTSITIRT